MIRENSKNITGIFDSLVALDQHGISLSSGSACKSGSPKPTHVLLAMGKTEEEAHCAVRLSLSHQTTEKDIDATVSALEQVLEEMETTVRFLPCKWDRFDEKNIKLVLILIQILITTFWGVLYS